MRFVTKLCAIACAMIVASIVLVGCSTANNVGYPVTSSTVKSKSPSSQVLSPKGKVNSEKHVENVAKVFQEFRNEGKDSTFKLSKSLRGAGSDIEPIVFEYLREIGGKIVSSRHANFIIKVRETRNRTCPGQNKNKTEQWSSITTQILDQTTRNKELLLFGEASSCYSKNNSIIEIRGLVERALYSMTF